MASASDWNTAPSDVSPYVHWFFEQDHTGAGANFTRFELPASAKSSQSNKIARQLYGGGAAVPLLAGSSNRDFEWGSMLPAASQLKKMAAGLMPGSVFTGIIDTGIAIANARFLRKDGTPRILASWQQTAGFKAAKGNGLPFGDVTYVNDIEDAIARNTFDGWCDEDSLNRDLEVSQFDLPFGQRDVELRAAHGTHVADLAAGFEREQDVDLRPMLCVNLPDRMGHGSAGNFLEFYAVFGIDWMVEITDALWKIAVKRWEAEGIEYDASDKGFPLVINLSYGKQAGPKDGTMPFSVACDEIVQSRIKAKKAPVYIVLPAGNDNLERCHAHCILGNPEVDPEAHAEQSIGWRIMPDDKTSNFVEIWSAPLPGDPALGADVEPVIDITDPSGTSYRVKGDKPAGLLKISPTCWLYYYRLPVEGSATPHIRMRYVLCARPSLSVDGQSTSQAGLWRIDLKYAGPTAEFSLHIQSDQALREDSRTGLRSYFDHPAYHTYVGEDDALRAGVPSGDLHIPQGKIADSFHYPDGTHLESWIHRGPVQRKGSLNALAGGATPLVIGGYRLSDGAPVDYSSTAHRPLRNIDDASIDDGRHQITSLFPTDDGVAHQGLRASGPRSGSIAVMQGTSMGSARAARYLVDALLDGSVVQSDAAQPLYPTQDQSAPEWPYIRTRAVEKFGEGRIIPSDTGLVDRRGRKSLELLKVSPPLVG